MQRILVTGAGGFIGGALARQALQGGAEVVLLGHGAGAAAASRQATVIDATVSAAALDRLPFVPELVVHCAGGANVQASVADPAADHARTVGGTAIVLEWLAQNAPAARLVYPSSGAVYGVAAGHPGRRDAALKPLSPYGCHKAEAEALIQTAAVRRGLNAAIVRLFSVYGPGLRKQLLWDACGKFQRGETQFFGTGAEKRDFIEIGDVVRLLMLAGQAASAEVPVMDGGTGQGVAIADLLNLLAQSFQPLPEVGFLGTGRPGDPVDMVADPAVAMALGWQPQVALAEGLGRYAAWFRAETFGA